jgi:actin beta/gamma 1
MDFGSVTLLAGACLGDVEDIYVDDVQDGIASMASEQAAAWVQEYKELEALESSSAELAAERARDGRKIFLKSLIALCTKVMNSKAGAKRGGAQHGPMGSRTRLQPRSANASFYDSVASAGVERDLAAASKNITHQEVVDALALVVQDEVDSKHCLMSCEDFDDQVSKFVTRFGKGETSKVVNTEVEAEDEAEDASVVIKIGSGFWSAGFSGDDAPRAVFPSIVGRAKHPGIMVGMDQKDAYIGDEAQCKRGVLTLRFPIEKGVITNLDDFSKILHHTFYNELRIAPEEHPVTIVSQPTSEHQISRMLQTLFETHNAPSVRMVAEHQMITISNSKMNGCVIDLGGKCARIAVVIKGAILDGSLVHCDVGGDDLTDYIMKIMTERGYSFTTTAERDIVRDIKEKMGMCVDNAEAAMKKSDQTFEQMYELPDGQVIILANERFRVNECWFAPNILGKNECLSLHSAVAVAVSRAPAAMRSSLLSNIMLAGGPALTPGLKERLEAEVRKILPERLSSSVHVRCSPNAKYQSWVGASVWSNFAGDNGMITRDEYDEYGPLECASYANSFLFCQPPPAALSVDPAAPSAPSSAPAALSTAAIPLVSSLKKELDTTTLGETKEEETKEVQASRETKEEIKEAKASEIAATKSLAHANTMLISSSDLISKAVQQKMSMDMLPARCAKCPAYFTSQSTFEHVQGSDAWSCSFCGALQPTNQQPPSVPRDVVDAARSQELDFVPKEAIINVTAVGESKLADTTTRLVVFCVDTSGSMGATTDMSGKGVVLHNGWKEKKIFKHVSRLQFVQSAVRAKILALARTDPSAIPVLLTFGSTVKIHLPDGTTAVVEGKTLKQTNTLLVKGVSLVKRFTSCASGGSLNGMRSSVKTLLTQLHAVEVAGCTAMGPALATAVGMCSNHKGSQIVVCTDGCANVGIGSLDSKGKDPEGFYTSIALAAKSGGTSVSILTLEGCEAGMETLGTAADLTSGRVTVVDPQDLVQSFSSMASEIIVGTNVILTVLAGNGASVCTSSAAAATATSQQQDPILSCARVNVGNAVAGGSQSSFSLSLNNIKIDGSSDHGNKLGHQDSDDDVPESFRCPISLDLMFDPVIMSDGFSYERVDAEEWLQDHTTSPLTNNTLSSTQLISNVTLRHSIEEYQALVDKQRKDDDEDKDEDESMTSVVPVQVQLTYSDAGNVPHVRVFTLLRAACFSRRSAEKCCNAKVCAISSIHTAAALAQQGEYETARIHLISTQRLLQRSMTLSSQKQYMAFVVLAEKLDNWMRESKQQEALLNVVDTKSKRDDDAASAMYQMKSLSTADFAATISSLC